MLDKLPYNADINLIASVPSLEYIYEALAGKESELSKGQRTVRTSNRLDRVIKKNLLVFHSENHKSFVNDFFNNTELIADKNIMLYLQLSVTNRLCYDLIDNVILNYYLQGRASINKRDLISYIKDSDLVSTDSGEIWADTTLERIGSKLLTFLKRIDILKGQQNKLFKNIRYSDRQVVLYLYFVLSIWGDELNILNHPFRKFTFSSDDILIERVKEVAKNGWIDMKYTGDKLIINPIFKYSQLANAIQNRTPTKI